MTANDDISLCVTSLQNIYFGIEAGWGGGGRGVPVSQFWIRTIILGSSH